MQTNFNEVLVLQQGEYSSVNNSRPTRKKGVIEILEEMKKREVKVQFKREPLIIFHAPTKDRSVCDVHTDRLIGLSMFFLLWVYGMAWISEISRHEMLSQSTPDCSDRIKFRLKAEVYLAFEV